MNEEKCWWCENGFDDEPIDGQEIVLVHGEPMHDCCRRASERFESCENYAESYL